MQKQLPLPVLITTLQKSLSIDNKLALRHISTTTYKNITLKYRVHKDIFKYNKF